MNRDHQRICPRCGTSPLADDVRCWNCDYPLPKVGDSTPPATPVEPPDPLRLAAATLAAEVLASKQNVGHYLRSLAKDVKWCASHPPAVSGEGERLMEQAAAYRAIALDALACWQGEDEHSDDNQKRNRSARSRATLRHRICAVDDTLRASTPTPGAEGR